MFPKQFKKPDHKFEVITHRAIFFPTRLEKDKVVKMLVEKGISDFVRPDKLNPGYSSAYNDDRIQGYPTIQTNADCCAFTRNSNMWYLFPIQKEELENVGLVEDDLIEWIKFLNETKAGFEYLYLGYQPGPDVTGTSISKFVNLTNRPVKSDQHYYWVAVPKFTGTVLKPYLHWVSLRYLFNTRTSGQNREYLVNPNKSGYSLPYYMIPRIALFLNKRFKLTKLKSYLYAHVTSNYFSGHGLAYTDFMGINEKRSDRGEIDYTKTYQAPCLNVTTVQFRKLLEEGRVGDTLNYMLTPIAFDMLKEQNQVKVLGLKNLNAPYCKGSKDASELYDLFYNEKYKEFIAKIQDAYAPEKKISKKKTTDAKTLVNK